MQCGGRGEGWQAPAYAPGRRVAAHQKAIKTIVSCVPQKIAVARTIAVGKFIRSLPTT
jgi:hypothetical protein